MKALALILVVAACTDTTETDLDLATGEEVIIDAKEDGPVSWDVAPTLHVGASIFDTAQTGGRRVHPLWVAGTPSSPVSLAIEVRAADGYDVRVAVLGPLRHGNRAVLAADGYASRKTTASVNVAAKLTGEHLVVIGSYNLATETFYDVIVRGPVGPRVDVLASPKAGALVGANGLLQAELGDVLANRTFDVELEVWASPPMQTWNATKIATSVASGNQVNMILPASVVAGDDLQLVVREAGGRVLDTGVITRFAPTATAFARTDAILYGDLVSVQIGGVVGYFEGVADMVLRSEQTGNEIGRHSIHAALPGATGIGFGAFDATFAPEIFDADGNLNPNLPHNGEKLSIGWVDGNGTVRRLACFEYCNDLSGMESCTGGPRACN